MLRLAAGEILSGIIVRNFNPFAKKRIPFTLSLYVVIFTVAALILHFLLPVVCAERNEAPVHRIIYDFLENCHILWLKYTYVMYVYFFLGSFIFIFFFISLHICFLSLHAFFSYIYVSPYLFSIQSLKKYR